MARPIDYSKWSVVDHDESNSEEEENSSMARTNLYTAPTTRPQESAFPTVTLSTQYRRERDTTIQDRLASLLSGGASLRSDLPTSLPENFTPRFPGTSTGLVVFRSGASGDSKGYGRHVQVSKDSSIFRSSYGRETYSCPVPNLLGIPLLLQHYSDPSHPYNRNTRWVNFMAVWMMISPQTGIAPAHPWCLDVGAVTLARTDGVDFDRHELMSLVGYIGTFLDEGGRDEYEYMSWVEANKMSPEGYEEYKRAARGREGEVIVLVPSNDERVVELEDVD